jgi:transposase
MGEPEGARRATGGSPIAERTRAKADFVPPDPQVPEKAKRRRFSAIYKLRILQEVDQAFEPGQVGSILRREGLYSSHLTTWNRQRKQGLIDALSSKKRGKKASKRNAQAQRIAELEREVEDMQEKLIQAERIIEVQKKSPRSSIRLPGAKGAHHEGCRVTLSRCGNKSRLRCLGCQPGHILQVASRAMSASETDAKGRLCVFVPVCMPGRGRCTEASTSIGAI